MNIVVHLMFAVTVRRCVKKTLGVSLNLPGFLYGNILPDISRKYGAYPHYMKDALIHVVDSKDNLLAESSQEVLSTYRFAREIGAINHYLSDFFCLPHTEEFIGGKLKHGLYELGMITRYKKGLRAWRGMLVKNCGILSPDDIKSFILNNSDVYKNKKASRAKDIGYALFAGSKLLESMIAYSESLADTVKYPVLSAV